MKDPKQMSAGWWSFSRTREEAIQNASMTGLSATSRATFVQSCTPEDLCQMRYCRLHNWQARVHSKPRHVFIFIGCAVTCQSFADCSSVVQSERVSLLPSLP